MPPPGGGMMGVSGGGGDPRCAFTVDVEAVELKRLMPPGFGMLSACGTGWLELEDAPAPVFALGGGQYCWWYSGNGFASVLPCLCGGLANSPSSLSGVSGPGESGRGLGAVPRRSASLEGWIEPSWFLPPYPPTLGLLGSCASKRARCPGERGAGAVAFELRLRPSGCGGVAFLAGRSRSRSLRGVYRPWLKLGGPLSSGYGRGAVGGGTVGGLVGGAGNEGIGGGREKAGGLLELPAESVRGGGLFEVGECFCILSGPTVGVASPSLSYRRKSSSSGRPCLRPSIVTRMCRLWLTLCVLR